MNHIALLSGGHSSAVTAIEVARRFGTEHLTLLNHDIIERSEGADIKRFKREIAAYIGLPITFCNMAGWDTKDQSEELRAELAKERELRTDDTKRLEVMVAKGWRCNGLKRDDGTVGWYVRDRQGFLLTQRHNSSREAIDQAMRATS